MILVECSMRKDLISMYYSPILRLINKINLCAKAWGAGSSSETSINTLNPLE